ncbi:MAG: alanine--tRNA ligase [Planctomycetota bacterium]
MHRSADDIRQAFLDFFRAKGGQPGDASAGHLIVPSSPTVPHDDPTLLFANAGMNQFKKVFLNQVEPGTELEKIQAVGRATDTQKCIRAGGKHNDLEDVGKDTYHHTFFEMLGNWSFGDYFKAEAIEWAWELLTEVFELPPEQLYATYFEGDAAQGLQPDLEARELWLRFLPESRVLPGNAKDNFWEMGETGPCGPCSELHFDRLGERDAAPLVNQDDPTVIEVWNLVFIQFDRQKGGELKPLPARHVDTGMGLERLVSILQGVHSNYDTDLFAPLFEAIRRATHAPREYMGRMGDKDEGQVDMAYRVIADHARTLAFAIADGAVPSNEGRGYVLRRVLRRAVRFGRQMHGGETGFLAAVMPAVVARMGDAFPELRDREDHIVAVVKEEEESFGRTLDRGIKLFDEAAARAESGRVTGADAFQLYDTFGFPLDLTELMAEERGLKVDAEGFERHMTEQRERSRAGGKKDGDDAIVLDPDSISRLGAMSVKPTDDSAKFDPPKQLSAHVKAIFNGRSFDQDVQADHGRRVGLILDRTSFYAEMGGQVADAGRLVGPHGEMRVEEVRSFGGFVLHIGTMVKGHLHVGDSLHADLDQSRRSRVASNHTATHLLNFGLRRALGTDADQRGSLVDADRLRFDFAHSGPMTPEQIEQTEATVRSLIDQNLTVYAEPSPLSEAERIRGLRAVFGEKYPDPVRVVSIGQPVSDLLDGPDNPAWEELSVEFCGGTHLETTSQAEAFALVQETGVAKGIRRVEALTGVAARAAIETANDAGSRIDRLASLDGDELASELSDLSAELDQLAIPLSRKHTLRAALDGQFERVKAAQKEAAKAKRAQATELARTLSEKARADGNTAVVASLELGDDREALGAAAKTIRDSVPTVAVFLVGTGGQKVALLADVPEELIAKGLKAGDWIKTVAPIVGGKGGGRPNQAQGAGTDHSRIEDAVSEARRFAAERLG